MILDARATEVNFRLVKLENDVANPMNKLTGSSALYLPFNIDHKNFAFPILFFVCSFLLLQKRTKKAGPKSMYNAISALALIELQHYCCAKHLGLDQQL